MLGAAGPHAPRKPHSADEPRPEWHQAAPSSARAGQASAPRPASAEPGSTASDEARGRGGCTKTQGCSEPQGTTVGRGPRAGYTQDPPIPSGKGPPSEVRPPITPGTLCRAALCGQAQPPRAGSQPRQGASWRRVCASGGWPSGVCPSITDGVPSLSNPPRRQGHRCGLPTAPQLCPQLLQDRVPTSNQGAVSIVGFPTSPGSHCPGPSSDSEPAPSL